MKPLALDYIKFDPETNEYRIEHIQSREHFEKKKIICVGIVGAFVPECTEDVVWEWARCSYSFTKGQKFNEVIIVSVNDAYVMQQFAQKVDLKDRISYIAD